MQVFVTNIASYETPELASASLSLYFLRKFQPLKPEFLLPDFVTVTSHLCVKYYQINLLEGDQSRIFYEFKFPNKWIHLSSFSLLPV